MRQAVGRGWTFVEHERRRAGTDCQRFFVDLPFFPEADDLFFLLGQGNRACDGVEHVPVNCGNGGQIPRTESGPHGRKLTIDQAGAGLARGGSRSVTARLPFAASRPRPARSSVSFGSASAAVARISCDVGRLQGIRQAHVGNDRKPQHPHAGVHGHEDLGHGRHAHDVGPDHPQEAILGPGFQIRARHRHVDALMGGEVLLPRCTSARSISLRS